MRDFYTPQHEYKLSGKANDLSLPEKTRTAVRTVDEKIQVITMFYNSEMLRIFPLPSGGKVEWHVPGSTELPRDVGATLPLTGYWLWFRRKRAAIAHRIK